MKTEVKERGTLFNAEMVRAFLDGRKTQTRRPLKPQTGEPEEGVRWVFSDGWNGEGWYFGHEDYPEDGSQFWKCPLGKPGDRLWGKETWKRAWCHTEHLSGPGVMYKDGTRLARIESKSTLHEEPKWIPSIHMPRWASRITLENTGVRVERVQDIGIYDIEAEGLDVAGFVSGYEIESEMASGDRPEDFWEAARRKFEKYWNTIYQPKGQGWDANDWVWVIELKVL